HRRDGEVGGGLRLTPAGVWTEGDREHDEQRSDSSGERQRAQPVNTASASACRREMRESQRHNGDGDDANRDVDIEDPLPTAIVRDIAADRRADNAGQTKDRAEKTLPAPALGRRQQVADDGKGIGGDHTGANTLEGAEEDQLRHASGQASDLNAKEVKWVG